MSPILDPNSLECPTHSWEQTQRMGVRLGELLRPGDLVCLEGALGAGKTCLAQGIGRGCGVTETLISPTYTFIHEYRLAKTGTRFNHVDLYRISSAIEAGDSTNFAGGTKCSPLRRRRPTMVCWPAVEVESDCSHPSDQP